MPTTAYPGQVLYSRGEEAKQFFILDEGEPLLFPRGPAAAGRLHLTSGRGGGKKVWPESS